MLEETESPIRGARVLVVEDDRDIRRSLQDLLADAGYHAEGAGDGRAALETLRRGEPADIILLDLMMPVMDGWQFRLEQRRDPVLCRIPVVALSADHSAKAAAVDAEAYLAKPLQINVLFNVIEQVLGRVRAKRLEAADRLAALGTLAAGIAHEINNPLTYVMANLQVLAATLPATAAGAGEIRELLTDALDGAERIRRIVRQVQAASPSGRLEEHGPVSLRSVLEAALGLVDNELRHRARVTVKLEGAPVVLGDRARLEQVFIHLLTNAAHAVEGRPGQQEVRVGLDSSAGEAVVEVADTGRGIAPELQNRVFQPFFTTKPVGAGTGLGLAICRSVVEALGGSIAFESPPAGGTVFRVALPLAEAAPAPAVAPAEARPAAEARYDRLRRVLIVDDEPSVLRSLRRRLGSEYQVTTAESARQALELVSGDDTFDVILCDLLMPDMSGIDLYDAVRTFRPALGDRMVFMSGGAFTAQGHRFLADGTHLCVDKPLDPEALEQAMVKLAARTGRSGSE